MNFNDILMFQRFENFRFNKDRIDVIDGSNILCFDDFDGKILASLLVLCEKNLPVAALSE